MGSFAQAKETYRHKALTLMDQWSDDRTLSTTDQQVFNAAMQGFVGVTYIPQSVSNIKSGDTSYYRFDCTASMPPSLLTWKVTLEVEHISEGNTFITGIKRNR